MGVLSTKLNSSKQHTHEKGITDAAAAASLDRSSIMLRSLLIPGVPTGRAVINRMRLPGIVDCFEPKSSPAII
jgi:hypothetical protein